MTIRCTTPTCRAVRRTCAVVILAASLLEPVRSASARPADDRPSAASTVSSAGDAAHVDGSPALDPRFAVVPGVVRRATTSSPTRRTASSRPAVTAGLGGTLLDALRRAADDPSIDPNVTAFREADTDWHPASPSLAVGGGFVVAAANAHFDFWRTDGARARTGDPIALTDWFAPVLSTVPPEFEMNATDPQVLRDPTTGRFVVAATAWPKDEALHWPVVVLSASATADPNGQWCSHFIPVGHDADGTNNAVFERFSMAMTRRGLVLLSNLIAHQGNHEFRFAAARIHVLPAAQLLGASCVAVDLEERDLIDAGNFERYDRAVLASAMPVGDHAFAVGSRSLGGDELRIWPIAVAEDGSIDEVLASDIDVEAYEVPPDAAQPGTDVELFTGGAEIRSAAVRGDDLWAVQSIDHGDRAGIGWHRIDVTDLTDREAERFTVGNADDVAYPAILPAPDCDNAYVVYSISAPDRFASVGLTDIRGDTVHTVVDGEGCIANRGAAAAEWGASSGIALDEATGMVWGHVGYAAGTAADCTGNGWETALFGAGWDICEGVGPAPTPTPPPGDSKGIGFALASKRVMRGVYGAGGLTARRGAMNGSALTGLQVQNIDGQLIAQPRLNFAEQRLPYEAAGRTLFSRTVDMRTIAPGASLNAYIPSLDLLDAMYRVTVTTPRDGGDLSAILRTDWDTGGAAVVSNLWFSPRTVIPHVTRNHQSHTTVLALTNAESTPVAVTLRFFRAGSATEVAAKHIDMQPTEALTFDLNDSDAVFRSLGDGFRGTAIVEAPGGSVGAQVYEYVESSALAIGGYEGIPADQGSSRLFVPLFRSQQHGPGGIRLNTAIAVANAGAQEASVTVTYRPTTNASASDACRAAGPVRHGPVRIPASSNFVFNQGPGGGHGLPENCFGSAVVETAGSGDTVVATVLDTQNNDETLSMINASPAEFAAVKMALPLFRSRHLVAAYTTGIQVMNTSDRAANVHIDFARSEGDTSFPIGGCRGQCDAIIRPFEAYTWWPPAVAAIPAGTYGAAVISSDQPIVVLVNDYPLNGNSDMATYAGIPVLTQP